MRTERVPLVREMLADDPPCWLGAALHSKLSRHIFDNTGVPRGLFAAFDACRGRADCVHERRKRGRGGSMTKRANLRTLCSPCNNIIESDADVARFAHEVGLVVRRGDPEWEELGNDRYA